MKTIGVIGVILMVLLLILVAYYVGLQQSVVVIPAQKGVDANAINPATNKGIKQGNALSTHNTISNILQQNTNWIR